MTAMNRRKRGNATVEMTLVGIPLMFILISIFEMSRGMWMYHTMAYSVKEGTRFAIVHGKDCIPSPSLTNNCGVTIGTIASRIRAAAIGLPPTEVTIAFSTGAGNANSITCTLDQCVANNTAWPPDGLNAPPLPLTIAMTCPFRSAIAMFWPGAGQGIQFAVTSFSASSTEAIQF